MCAFCGAADFGIHAKWCPNDVFNRSRKVQEARASEIGSAEEIRRGGWRLLQVGGMYWRYTPRPWGR